MLTSLAYLSLSSFLPIGVTKCLSQRSGVVVFVNLQKKKIGFSFGKLSKKEKKKKREREREKGKNEHFVRN